MIKKKILCLSLIGIMSISGVAPAFAEENDNSIPTVLNTGAVIVNDTDNITTKAIGHHTREIVVSKTRKNHVFVGYLTKSWKRASKYTISKGANVSGSFTYGGISVSLSLSNEKEVVIPADPKRYSKVAGYADITFTKIKTEYYISGDAKPYKTGYYVKKTYHDTYIKPKYKS